MARILLHTLGSSGDINPFLALGLALQQRGHAVKFAVSPSHATLVRSLGIDAAAVGPEMDADTDLMRKLLRPEVVGPIETLFRDVLIPSIGPATESLEPLVQESDLFISHIIQLAAPIVAYRTGVPWISATPTTNCYPSHRGDAPGIAWRNPPAFLNKLIWSAVRAVLRPLDRPIEEQYLRYGVPPRGDNAIFGSYSELLTIGLWSPSFFARPDDWPEWLQVGGYARWDAPAILSPNGDQAPGSEISLPGGDAPLIIFTLGSSVVNDPRGYYEMALEALRPTGWRAVLLGAPDDFEMPVEMASRVVAVRYARYADLFPLASAVVHQGGVGTTQAASYYGVPAIVVPRGFDQFENAAHIQRHRLGLRIAPSSFSATLLRVRLERLLSSAEIRCNTSQMGDRMRAERGAAQSADLVEMALEPGFRAGRSSERAGRRELAPA